jgi:protein SCO1/2
MTPVFAAIVWLAAAAPSPARHPALGLVLDVNRTSGTLTVSHQEIPGFMDAMVMTFAVRKPEALAEIAVGVMVELTIVEEKDAVYAEDVRPHEYVGRDPQAVKAQQLELLQALTDEPAPAALPAGAVVPDFSLVDQSGRTVQLSQLEGKVVVISFMYTRCRLANACFRLSNNLAILRDRLRTSMGKDVVLLTITFDPANDGPEALRRYASAWDAEGKSEGWHFLTGPVEDVRRVCHLFGMNFWADLGMITHTMRTAVLDRDARLVTNLTGNDFTAQQLGDLVSSLMRQDRPSVP